MNKAKVDRFVAIMYGNSVGWIKFRVVHPSMRAKVQKGTESISYILLIFIFKIVYFSQHKLPCSGGHSTGY